MVQLVRGLLHEDWSLGPQDPHKKWGVAPICNPSTEETEIGDQ